MKTLMILSAVASVGALQWDGAPERGGCRMHVLPGEPVIHEVKPPSARVGERVKIEGENFDRGVPVVTFSGIRATVIKAEDDELRVVVPQGATTGPLVIAVGDHASRPVHFVVEGTSTRLPPALPAPRPSQDSSATSGTPHASNAAISFSRDIQPIFDRSCTNCHGGSAGLFLDEGESYANLVNVQATKGCTSEMRVQPGKAEASVLFKRISGTACGTQMPKKGSPLSVEEIDTIRRWIDAGAPNN